MAALVPPGFVDRTWTVSERSSIGKGPFVDRSRGGHVRRFEGVDRPHVAAGFEDTRPNPRWEFLLHSGVEAGPWGRRRGGEARKACGGCEGVRGGGNLHRHHVRARISPSVHARAGGRRNSISVNWHACIYLRHRPLCLETRRDGRVCHVERDSTSWVRRMCCERSTYTSIDQTSKRSCIPIGTHLQFDPVHCRRMRQVSGWWQLHFPHGWGTLLFVSLGRSSVYATPTAFRCAAFQLHRLFHEAWVDFLSAAPGAEARVLFPWGRDGRYPDGTGFTNQV